MGVGGASPKFSFVLISFFWSNFYIFAVLLKCAIWRLKSFSLLLQLYRFLVWDQSVLPWTSLRLTDYQAHYKYCSRWDAAHAPLSACQLCTISLCIPTNGWSSAPTEQAKQKSRCWLIAFVSLMESTGLNRWIWFWVSFTQFWLQSRLRSLMSCQRGLEGSYSDMDFHISPNDTEHSTMRFFIWSSSQNPTKTTAGLMPVMLHNVRDQ